MGIVTDYLIDLVQRQVDEHGTIIWFDPLVTYIELSKGLTLPQTQVALYNGSYLELRRSLDPAMNDIQSDIPPRLLIYAPFDRSSSEHNLDEFIFAGAVMQPGEASPRNTDLGVIARDALRTLFGKERLNEISEEIRKGKITTLEELDRLAEQGDTGALSLVFGTSDPFEIVTRFMISDQFDSELVTKDRVDDLATMWNELFGLVSPQASSPSAIRSRLNRHILLADFRLRLRDAKTDWLKEFPLPESDTQRVNCLRLANTWRQRRDMQEAYLIAARRVEAEVNLTYSDLEWDTLQDVETFPGAEERLQASVASAMTNRPTHGLVELANRRRIGFWSECDQEFGAVWATIAAAGGLLLKILEIREGLNSKGLVHAKDFISRYTIEPGPWCQMDTLHRLMERLSQALDFDPAGKKSALEKLLARTRQEYSQAIDLLSEQFSAAFSKDGFVVENMLYQSEVFSRYITPIMTKAKTAYVLVDALRYEMALDLASSVDRDWKVTITPAIATLPTITPVGMASLMPGAERGISLAYTGDLAAEVGGQILRTRQDRLAYLASKITDMTVVKLEQLVPAKKLTREALQAARFILVTSQEIDLLGEGDSIAQAREFMDHTLVKLARAFRVLADNGVERIVVVADHGYIFADELDTDVTIPSPGGQTVDLHRRVWIGKGGQALDRVIRVPVEKLNLGGDYEFVTPVGLACFAAPGGKAFFHGGLSLQELVIPVMVLEPASVAQPTPIEWVMTLGREKISTRFASVQITGRVLSQSMFQGEPPLVRVEIRSANKSISAPVTATYGLQDATGEIQMRWKVENPFELDGNTVTLMISSDISQKKASVVLIDAETERILNKTDVEITLSI